MEYWSIGKNIHKHFIAEKRAYSQQPDFYSPYFDIRADIHIEKLSGSSFMHFHSNNYRHSITPPLRQLHTEKSEF